MLQRAQTFWTLLATACAVLTLKFQFYSGNKLGVPPTSPKTFEHLTATSNIIILILTVTIIVAGLVNTFNYKNRPFQLRITMALILISVLNIILYYFQSRKFLPGEGSFALTSLLTLAIPVFFIFASRGIYKDEKLVKSADRLR